MSHEPGGPSRIRSKRYLNQGVKFWKRCPRGMWRKAPALPSLDSSGLRMASDRAAAVDRVPENRGIGSATPAPTCRFEVADFASGMSRRFLRTRSIRRDCRGGPLCPPDCSRTTAMAVPAIHPGEHLSKNSGRSTCPRPRLPAGSRRRCRHRKRWFGARRCRGRRSRGWR